MEHVWESIRPRLFQNYIVIKLMENMEWDTKEARRTQVT